MQKVGLYILSLMMAIGIGFASGWFIKNEVDNRTIQHDAQVLQSYQDSFNYSNPTDNSSTNPSDYSVPVGSSGPLPTVTVH